MIVSLNHIPFFIPTDTDLEGLYPTLSGYDSDGGTARRMSVSSESVQSLVLGQISNGSADYSGQMTRRRKAKLIKTMVGWQDLVK